MKKLFNSLFFLSICVSALAQLPQFDLISPANPADLEVDFFRGGKDQHLLVDIDSDNDLDFIHRGFIDGQFFNSVVYLNDGIGNFTISPNHPFSDLMVDLGVYAFADLNGDDIQDVIYSGKSFTQTVVSLGDGSGDFNEKSDVNYLPLSTYGHIVPVDIDLDNDMDLLMTGGYTTSNYYTGLWLNDGDANFTEVTTTGFENLGGTSSIAVSRPYDGGKYDIAVVGTNSSYNQKRLIYQYDGAGTFSLTSSTTLVAKNSFSELAFGDVNGDGVDDLFALGRQVPSVRRTPNIYLNDGTGNYTLDTSNRLYSTYATSTTGKEVFFGDVTGDGVYDVGVSDLTSDILLFLNDGSGAFSEPVVYESDYYWKRFALGDIDGDSDTDFIKTAVAFNTSDPEDDNAMTHVYLNDGTGTFETFNYDLIEPLGNSSLLVTDFDLDGFQDILISGQNAVEDAVGKVYANDGMFQFTEETFPGTAISHSAYISLDYNRDGREDVLMVGQRTGTSTKVASSLLLKQADGSLSSADSNPFNGVKNGDIVQLDVDGDRDLDLVMSGEEGTAQTHVYLNYGKSDYRLTSTSLPVYSEVAMDIADANGDEVPDIIMVGTSSGATTSLMLGDGNGDFVAASNSLPAIWKGDASFGDLDNDGDQDLVLAGGDFYDSDYYQQVYLNNGAGVFTLHQSLDGIANASIHVFDVDLDGDLDFMSSGFSHTLGMSSTRLYLNDGLATFMDSGMKFRGLQDARIALEDLDQDYDKDLILLGEEGEDGAYHARVYQNTATYSIIKDTVTNCGNYYFFGEELSASGDYAESMTTSEGESREVTLNLTLLPSTRNTLEVEALGSYVFNDEPIFESGIYEGYYINTFGCDSVVTLDLTINDHLDPGDYEHVNYELILPEAVPQFQTDFANSRYGASTIYDMDGDGDQDYLLIGESTGLQAEVIGYLNQGDGSYVKKRYPHITFSDRQALPWVLHGDLNGDGIEDLIITGERFLGTYVETDLGTRMFFGDATGNLTLQPHIALPSTLYGFIELADLTGDGHLDMLVGDINEGTYLHINDGTGSFTRTAIPELSINIWAWDLAISPVYDGKRDIIYATLDTSYKPYYRHFEYDGAFTLISEGAFKASDGSKIHFGDANADGAPDILVTNNSYVEFYMNDGTGNYAWIPDTFEDFGSTAYQARFLDLNNDAAADVLIDRNKYPQNDSLYVFWNDGFGSFIDADTIPFNETAQILATGDLTGDGYPDLIYNGMDEDDHWVSRSWINDQSNGFREVTYGITPQVSKADVKFGDIDQDGDQDLVLAGFSANHGPITSIYNNDGTGSFSPVATHDIDSLQSSSLALEDIDGNGTLDLVISGSNSMGDVVTRSYTNVDGVFQENPNFSLLALTQGKVAFFDANDDGYKDLLTVGRDATGTGQAYLYLNDGSGILTAISSGLSGLGDADFSIGDVNDDGHEDLLLTGDNDSGGVDTKLYLGAGEGTFTEDTSLSLARAKTPLLMDMDLDGDLDIYLAGNGIQYTYTNDGSGSFSISQIMKPVWQSSAVWDDVDLDGYPDIIVSGNWISANLGGNTYLYVNDGNGNFTRTESNPFQHITQSAIHIADIDGDWDKDFVIAGSITGNTYATRLYRNTTCLTEYVTLEPIVTCDPYNFYDTILMSTGTYFHTLTNADGCVRQIQLDFTWLADEVVQEVEACGSYEWNGATYTVSGSYASLFTNTMGCDSTATLNLTILEPTSGEEHVEACESYEWEGDIYTTSGTYHEILTNSVGCDSTAILNLNILEPTSGEEHVEACESYEWEGEIYTTSGSYQELLTNSVGCDSTATLNLTLLEPTSGAAHVEACESYEWEGEIYTTSGSYQEILTNSVGCDSTATLNLNILEPTSGTEHVEACESYEWEGDIYMTSGSYQEILTNSIGCDSTATLNLTILEPTSGEEHVEACESYEWGGEIYTTSGSYQEMLTNSEGCDSTATLNLTILEPTSGSENIEACESYDWNGTTYTISGTYQESYTNSLGCDSTAILNLTIREPSVSSHEVIACERYEWNGIYYTESGTYDQVFTDVEGCDSTATMVLSLFSPHYIETTVNTCGSYEWYGETYEDSGFYERVLTSSVGCDSTIAIHLNLDEVYDIRTEIQACEYYEFDGEFLGASGQYAALFASSSGCDSLVTIDLTVSEPYFNPVALEVCGSYTFGSQTIIESGLYLESYLSESGCDSVVSLTIEMLEEPGSGISQNGRVLFAEDNSTGLTYQWIDCEKGEVLEGEDKRQLTPPRAGSYAVEVTNAVCQVTSGCYEILEDALVLDSEGPNHELEIFPNPSSGPIHIKWRQSQSSEVSIIGMDGRLIDQMSVLHGDDAVVTIETSGLYIVRIRNLDSGTISDHKVQVR